MKKLLFLLLLVVATDVFAKGDDPYMGIIPAPVSIKKFKGEFKLTSETLVLTDSGEHKAIKFFARYLKKTGLGGSITDINVFDKNHRNIKNSITVVTNFTGDLPPEGYELTVDGDHVVLHGRGPGLFYGIQTLVQLIQYKPGASSAAIPFVAIMDYPRFGYRGMHLDVARHFFDVDFVKKYLDLMAAYKLNTFHWHLSDDQGWRIEIKKYPKLTEVGSMRAQTKIGRAGIDTGLYDNTPYGGFYTQEQIQEVVAYASERYITVVPEIDMPGHSMAAIAAYPELSCDPTKSYKVAETWGGFTDNVLCPTEENFKMIDEILQEVLGLFPGKYMHVGGDECNKTAWKASEFCRQLIIDRELKDENGLQSYFISRIERFVNSQGHSIIGWDEILEGGLAPNATVMSWRGEAGGIAAAKQGHDVIMSPGTAGMYFDHAQSKSTQEPLSIGGFAPLAKTYKYDPVPSELSRDEQKHIIGVQGNLWTEYIATPEKAEYMLLPRMLALAEVAWTPTANKNYKNFSEERVPHNLARLEVQGYNFRVPVAIGAEDTVISKAKYNADLQPSVEGATIHYTIDGYAPRETDVPYIAPLEIVVPDKKTIDFKTIVVTPSGKRSIVTDTKIEN